MAVKVRSLKSQNQSLTPKAQSPRPQGSRARGMKARKSISHTVNNNGQVLFDTNRRIHFIGIGGIGMSGIAELLLNLGYEVSGSDMHRTDITDRLESLGARIAEGHEGINLGNAEVVVYSSAVKPGNAEMVAARERKLEIVGRADLL